MGQLMGREDELATLFAVVESGGVLLVRGEAGAGKTALLEELIQRCGERRIFRAGGVEGLGDVPWAGLAELLRPVDASLRVDATLSPLAAVVGLQSVDRVPSQLELESALLEVMRAHANSIWVIDDAQWLDDESARLLARAGRQARVVGTPMVFTTRSVGFQGFGLPELRLGGLGDGDALQLLAARHGLLPAEVVRWTLDVSRGNPLGLLELPRAYLRDADAAKVGASISDRLLDSFGGQIAKFDAEARLAVVAAALADPGDGEVLARVLERLGIDPSSLAAAERHDLVHVDDGRIHFRHPLVRHAADRSATTDERRRILHAWSAVSLWPDRALRYRAGATVPPDDDLAETFDRAADDARARVAFAAEWRHRRDAARFSADREERAQRMVAAAGAAERAGDRPHAEELLDQGIALDSRLADDPDVILVQFRLSTARGDVHDVRGLAERAIVRSDHVSPMSAIRGLRLALFQRMMLGQADEAMELSTRALELAGTDPAAQFLADEAAAMALTQVGRIEDAVIHGRRAVAHVDAGHGDPERIVTLGLALTWLEMYADASRLLSGEVSRHRRAGNARALAGALGNLADLSWRTGDLPTARLLADEAVAVADALVDRSMLVDMLATAGHVALLRGDADADEMLGRAERLIVTSASNLWIGAARAQLQLFRGDGAGALSTIADLGDLEPNGFREPNELRLSAMRLRALMLTGRVDEARRRLTDLETAVSRGSTRWTAVTFHRFAALMTDDVADADSHLAEARRALAPVDGPIEHGLIELDCGRVLRRAGRRADARGHLERAHQLFDAAGATTLATTAAKQIGATAPRLRPRTPASGIHLTDRELAVARLAAQGASDKEIAATLFVSAKTVSFHLANTFRKLGLTSRHELSGTLPRADVDV